MIEMNTLEFTFSFDFGQAGLDTSPLNPLTRALRRLLREDGQPFARLCPCFYRDRSGVAHWLGVFVHSAGDRVVFFPAHPDTIDTVQTFRSEVETANRAFAFDHATLERDLKTWHVTSTSSKDHIAGPRTFSLGDGRVLWFGMSVASVSVLRTLHNETVITAEVPGKDARRRADVVKAARENMAFPIVSLSTDVPPPFDGGFLHFAVIAGPKGFADYTGYDLGFPFGSCERRSESAPIRR